MSPDATFRRTSNALRETTARLCDELTAPSAIPPDWTEFEWGIARAVATMHGISALLAERLRWRGPPEWQQFIDAQREQGIRRDRRIGLLIDTLDAALARAGIAVVGLKGTALRAHRVFAPGARPMGDVDLLARVEDVPAITATLGECGYFVHHVSDRHIVFDVPGRPPTAEFGEHESNTLRIEVHTWVAEPLPMRFVDISARLWPTHPRPGINAYRDIAALFLHLLLHAAGNMRGHALRLLQLWDLAELSRRFEPEDWIALVGPADPHEQLWWMWPPLSLGGRCASLVVPESSRAMLEAACPRTLARAASRHSLYEVSWSNLRISAFPGIEWSRTPFEALRYARSRIAPGRAALQELEDGARDAPMLVGSRWYETSHVSRIARWMFSKPRRVQTMYSIRTALANGATARPG